MDELINKAPQVLSETGEGETTVAVAEAPIKNAPPAEVPESWHGSLDEELRQDPSLTKFKSPNELAKSYKNLESKLGKDKILKPNDKWTDKEWNEFYTSVGRPAAPEKYTLTKVELPQGMKASGGTPDEFQQVAFKHGLTQKQADGIYKDSVAREIRKAEAINQAQIESQNSAINALREEWGVAYDTKMKLATKTFMSVADESAKARFLKDGLGNDPAIIKMFAKLGSERTEDSIGSGSGSGEGVLTPDEAKREIATINGNRTHPYWEKNHPEHKFAIAKMEALYQMAYPHKDSDVITD